MIKTLQLLLALCCFVFVLFSPYTKLFVKVMCVICFLLWGLIAVLRSKLPQPAGEKLFLNFMPPNPLNKFVLFFLSSAVFSTLLSVNIAHSQRILIERYILFALFFIYGAFISYSKKYVLPLIIVFAASGFIFGIGGIWDYFRSLNMRLFTIFGKPVDFTIYLGFFIPLSCALAFFAKNKLLRFIGWGNIFLLWPCLVFNASRALWVAAPMAVLFICFLKNKNIFLIVLLVITIGWSFLSPVYKKRASTTFDVSTWNRIDIYMSAIKIFKDYPVYGAGLGMSEKLLRQYAQPGGFSDGDKHLHAHNTYLEVMADMGITGAILFMLIFAGFFTLLLRDKLLWLNYPCDEQAILLGLSGSVLATLIVASAATIITVGVTDSTVFWFLLGIVSGLLPAAQRIKAATEYT